jgi:protease IV
MRRPGAQTLHGHAGLCPVLSLACALLACEGRPRAGSPGAVSRDEPSSGPAIAVLDLSEGAPEQPPPGFLGLSSKSASFEELVGQMESIGRDRRLRGVLVRLGTTHVGLAQASEIGAMLVHLGEKLPVWCHADDLGNGTMSLAARGCKRIWLSPGGSVDAIGIAAQMVYFHKLLADDLGLDVDFLQVGKYKGAEEPFTRDGPSPEARASLQTCLSGIRAAWLDGIRTGRPSVEAAAPEDGPYSAPGAKQRGLIDDVGYFDDARTALENETHASRAEVRLGPGSESDSTEVFSDVMRAVAGDSMTSAQVVVVRAVGAISMDGGGLLGQGGGIVERRLMSTLLRLERDDDVRAVVLRIDSPGGSALASDLLWHELMRIRAKKPLVVSIGDMAASGGYYLASAGSAIFADPTSIVGSIGVVSGKVAATHALERIGVHSDTVAANGSDPHAAARAAYESLLVPWDDATRRRLLETMTEFYDLFLSRIAAGRGISVERVAASAEGRIFDGREGKARGLVDELGGLLEAIGRARALSGLPADARVGVARESGGLIQELLQDEPQGKAQDGLLAPLLARITPELVPFVASIAPIASHEVVLCSLPFALVVR